MKFKTTINCNGCLEKVTPVLENLPGIESWSVDLNTPEKILTVKGNTVYKEQVIEAVNKIGFKIEIINEAD